MPNPSLPELPPAADIQKLVADALREDIGSGDLTADVIDADCIATAQLMCRQGAMLCGVAWVNEVFAQVDETLDIHWVHGDGAFLRSGDIVCEINGAARAILSAERTAINLLQTLSAVATETRRYVDAAAGFDTQIMDTRKTLPGLRVAQKYAVAVGGGRNHRLGLYDQILIKENHIAAAGSVAAAMARASAIHATAAPPRQPQIEVESLVQLRAALAAGAQCIMLDNFSPSAMCAAVELTRGRATLEASGNVRLSWVEHIAAIGVDFISVGALTKNITAIDFSLRLSVAR